MKPEINVTAISFDIFPWLNPISPLKILENPKLEIYDEKKTIEYFKILAKEIYIPVLKFFLEQEVKSSIILTGRFLEFSQIHEPKIIELLKKLIAKDLINVVANGYFGNSESILYQVDWWSFTVFETMKQIEKNLKVKPVSIYLSQLFRGLELEKVIELTNVNSFLLSLQSKKYLSFRSNLSDLRRFDGSKVAWLQGENDKECEFHFLPIKNLFYANGNIFQKNLKKASKSFTFAAGFASSEYEIQASNKKIRKMREYIRFPEKPSLAEFSNLQRGVLRLKKYCLARLALEPNALFEKRNSPRIMDFLSIVGHEFLFYFYKNLYLEKNVEQFSSPYEAFVTVQSILTKIELEIEKG